MLATQLDVISRVPTTGRRPDCECPTVTRYMAFVKQQHSYISRAFLISSPKISQKTSRQ